MKDQRRCSSWQRPKNITRQIVDLYNALVCVPSKRQKEYEEFTRRVKNACLNVKDTEGIILHSDLGSQYTSQAFEGYLISKKIRHSFSRKGNPYDNACIESFHSVLKKEEIYLHTYRDFKESRKAVFEYIESWYNRKRIHSAIDYMTPQQKEDEELKKSA